MTKNIIALLSFENKNYNEKNFDKRTEPVFVNVYGAQESIPPAYVVCSLAGRYDK
jgi:hypothetical protein